MSSPKRSSQAPLDRPTYPEAQRLARIAGILLLATFVTAIGAVLLYDPALDRGYVVGDGEDTSEGR